jgi:hypothetical protein
VRQVIERHLPSEQFEILKATEESGRRLIAGLVHAAVGGGQGRTKNPSHLRREEGRADFSA